jgi:hypothetical protein
LLFGQMGAVAGAIGATEAAHAGFPPPMQQS